LQTAAGGTIAISGTAALRADAAGSGTLAANLYIDAASAATLDTQGFALAHSGAIAGAGATGVLYKTGSGALTLLGDSPAFSGTFNINAGRVTLAGGANLGGAAVVASGAALGGASDSAGLDVAVRAGGLLEAGPGGGVTGTLALRSLALENGATLQFTLLDGGTGSRLTVAAPANATPASGTAYINLLAGFASDGMVNYNLGNLAALNGSLAVRVNDADADATARQNAELSTSADDLLLAFGTDKSRRMTWNLAPASGGVWDGGAPNWRDSGTDASVKNKFLAGDAMAFDGAFSGTVDIQPSGAAQVVVSELSINTTGAGTLSLTGSGIFASATTARNLGFAASGKLIKTGSGTLVLANDANYFEAGILINEGVIEYTHGAQLATSGTASVALGGDATLRAGADMTAPGAGLGGLLDLGAHTLTFDTAGHNAALSGTTLGPGTLVKTGDGWLELSGTAALGHAATRIDAGLIKLGAAVAADAAGVAHTFDLNGGWLDLSDTGTGAPGNEWAASLMLTGGTGRVIGGNDYITPGSGTHAYQIGGVADEDRGVYVIIENGAATLTGSNNYMGYTRINATGTLNVSADSQLGDTAVAREVILNGGLLRVTESFATARKIELRAGGTVSVAGGATTAWAGTTEAPGDSFIFTKDGAGTLVLGGALGHKGGTVVRSGTLAGDAGNFTGAVEALADGAVVFAQAATGTFSGTVSGAGVWRKTGAASPVFAAGARIATETVSIDEGVFTSARNDTFAGVRDFVIASGGTLAGSGTVAAALFTNRGAIIGPNPTRRLSTTSAAATAWSRRASRWSSDAASAFTARAHGASAARSRATASISG
jgi:autotransporter-associated beta strand protein